MNALFRPISKCGIWEFTDNRKPPGWNFFDAMRLVQSMADSPSVFAFAGVRCGVRILIPEFANEYLQTIVYGHLHELFLIVLPDRSTQLFQRH
jgi:hypothetical protein